MAKELTDQERAIIQQAILDRWNPHRLTWKIANHFDLSVNQIRHIKSKATFKAEYAKQLAIYQGSFSDIQLGDRKERVKAMDDLYHLIPDYRVALKLKVLAQIRHEVGHDQPIEEPPSEAMGLNLPPRAQSYEEWLKQNRMAEKERQAG
jgi:hypothetical protein